MPSPRAVLLLIGTCAAWALVVVALAGLGAVHVAVDLRHLGGVPLHFAVGAPAAGARNTVPQPPSGMPAPIKVSRGATSAPFKGARAAAAVRLRTPSRAVKKQKAAATRTRTATPTRSPTKFSTRITACSTDGTGPVLSLACRERLAAGGGATPSAAEGARRRLLAWKEVMDRKDIPPRFVSRCELPSTSANKVSHSREKLGAHLKARIPTHVMTFCIPDGVIADNSVAGPFNQVDEDRIYLYQRKEWFANVDGFKQLIDKKDLRTVHIPGMGVQLSAWTGYSWSHFALDSLIRLGFVLERLQSTDPLWGKAKIVLNMHPEKGMDSTYEDMDHMVQWVLEELGLKDRALPNNGWLVKAKSTFRFDYLVFVDVDPHFRCGPNQFVKENVFPRGSLLPVQKALGVLGAKRDLIVWAGREGRRAVDPDHKKKLQEGIMKLVHEHGLKLAFHEFHYDNNPWEVRDVYRRAAIVLGPHGGQLWNMALAAPGALVIEFATWNDTFHEQDCRTSGYSLANAAGHEYWVVDTENFGHFEGHELLPNIADVLRIVDGFLETHDDAD